MTSTGVTLPIRVATLQDQDRAFAALALAFAADPVSRWTWRDSHTYLTQFASFAWAFGGGAFAAGSAYVIGDFDGVALWLPPGVQSDEEAMGALLVQTVPEAVLPDLLAVVEQMNGHHPSEPHWFLPLIGIDPTQQGRGLGSALLKHALAACDRDGVPAYLESSNPKNVPLYQRHGFEVIGEIQAGSSPIIHGMLRQAR
jgi:ribosomal protein S18 acetylase RimI-like enzyme